MRDAFISIPEASNLLTRIEIKSSTRQIRIEFVTVNVRNKAAHWFWAMSGNSLDFCMEWWRSLNHLLMNFFSVDSDKEIRYLFDVTCSGERKNKKKRSWCKINGKGDRISVRKARTQWEWFNFRKQRGPIRSLLSLQISG